MFGMATNRSLDSLVAAANMIEKSKGDRGCSSKEDASSNSEYGGDSEIARNLSSRMNHNVLERNRRAQMRQNFSSLQKMLPKLSGLKKVSNVCILKAATNEIQNLLDEDSTYRQEKEKLRESNMTLAAKLRKLKGVVGASTLDQLDLVVKETGNGLNKSNENLYETAEINEDGKESGKSEIGVNTDFPLDKDDDSSVDPEDIHIEIED